MLCLLSQLKDIVSYLFRNACCEILPTYIVSARRIQFYFVPSLVSLSWQEDVGKSPLSHSVHSCIFLQNWLDTKMLFFSSDNLSFLIISLCCENGVNKTDMLRTSATAFISVKIHSLRFKQRQKQTLCFHVLPYILKGDNPGWVWKCWLSKGWHLTIVDIMMDTRDGAR